MLFLRRLSDNEFDHAVDLARQTPTPLFTCPTCSAKLKNGTWEGESRYLLGGAEHECECHDQYTLRMHYLLASIPEEYYRLDFDADYNRSDDVKAAVNNYLDRWQKMGSLGIGLTFHSQGLGTGKTFAAAHVAKAIVRRKMRVRFISFRHLIGDINGSYQAARPYQDVAYLVIDEVVAGWSEASGGMFADNFEHIIRHRAQSLKPTILTTNLTTEEFAQEYPRIASLLMPKTIEIEMPGGDYRDNNYAMQTLALAANGEAAPIT